MYQLSAYGEIAKRQACMASTNGAGRFRTLDLSITTCWWQPGGANNGGGDSEPALHEDNGK